MKTEKDEEEGGASLVFLSSNLSLPPRRSFRGPFACETNGENDRGIDLLFVFVKSIAFFTMWLLFALVSTKVER